MQSAMCSRPGGWHGEPPAATEIVLLLTHAVSNVQQTWRLGRPLLMAGSPELEHSHGLSLLQVLSGASCRGHSQGPEYWETAEVDQQGGLRGHPAVQDLRSCKVSPGPCTAISLQPPDLLQHLTRSVPACREYARLHLEAMKRDLLRGTDKGFLD